MWKQVNVPIEKSVFNLAIDLFFSVNDISIDDGMLFDSTRKDNFIQHTQSFEFVGDTRPVYFEGEDYDHDALYTFGFQLSQEGKSYTRTRRKFWDDVSTRGGQYSSAIIALTALYYIIQWPFTEMILGLKFARMRM